MDLLQVVYHTEQAPLCIDLPLAAQSEPIKAQRVPHVGKGRFGSCHSHAIDRTAHRGVNLPFHLFGEGVFALLGPAVKVGYLPGLGAIRVTQAF